MSPNETIREKLNLSACDQVGFVFKDIETAIARYEGVFGSFERMDPGEMVFQYRGKEEKCELQLAFAKSGDLEIELIGWVSGGCPHKEFIDAGREGMMHLRFLVDQLDSSVKEAEKLGYNSIWSKRWNDKLAVAYLEHKDDPLVLEFFENTG